MTAPDTKEIVTATIVAERAGVLSLAKRQCVHIDRVAARGTISDADATLLKQQTWAFADQVAQGLHIQADDDAAVRAAMRDVVRREQA